MKNKHLFFIIIIISILSCQNKAKEIEASQTIEENIEIHSIELQKILDDALLEGTILIYDEQKGNFYSNNFKRAKTGFLPASTFKIPNSIIALETGVIKDETTILKWNGENHLLDIWEKDMSFKKAYQLSCVPCYREIARKVGLDNMQEYVDKLDFGKMEIDSSNLDLFWLTGNSRISPFEQIAFLKKLNHSQLAISKRTEQIMKVMMTIENNDLYHLRGKTGWSNDNDEDIGWFVAILEIKGATYYLATNIEPRDSFDMKGFSKIRQAVSMEAFRSFNIIQ